MAELAELVSPAHSPAKSVVQDSLADICALCDEEVVIEERTKYTTSRWVHKECKTNLNRQLERVKKDTKLKKWWCKLNSDEKKEWFKQNKGLEKGKKKSFENTSYQQKKGKES